MISRGGIRAGKGAAIALVSVEGPGFGGRAPVDAEAPLHLLQPLRWHFLARCEMTTQSISRSPQYSLRATGSSSAMGRQNSSNRHARLMAGSAARRYSRYSRMVSSGTTDRYDPAEGWAASAQILTAGGPTSEEPAGPRRDRTPGRSYCTGAPGSATQASIVSRQGSLPAILNEVIWVRVMTSAVKAETMTSRPRR